MESAIHNGDLSDKTAIFELQSYIESIENNSLLYQEKNFDRRNETIDFIGFQFMDEIEYLLSKKTQPDKLISLRSRAEKIKSELEAIDTSLVQKLRSNIQTGAYKGTAFRNLVNEYFDVRLQHKKFLDETSYDNLDIFVNSLITVQAIPEPTIDLEPDMIYYQKTPARIVFELVRKSNFKKEDVFFDIGSGLGQTAILVNLLAGVTVRGIEFEPAFCHYAKDCAKELNLSQTTFINVDARKADYSEGTVFFMFTPFKGEMLKEVLEMLKKESLQRKIKLITYGPCTAEVAGQSWLKGEDPNDGNIYRLGIFGSR